MSRPRRDRWLTLVQVAELLKLTHATKAARRRHVLRLIRGVEYRTRTQLARRFGNRLYVSVNALEALLPITENMAELERQMGAIRQNQDSLNRKVNGHGSRIRKLELGQQFTADYLAKMAGLDRVKNGSETGHDSARVKTHAR